MLKISLTFLVLSVPIYLVLYIRDDMGLEGKTSYTLGVMLLFCLAAFIISFVAFTLGVIWNA